MSLADGNPGKRPKTFASVTTENLHRRIQERLDQRWPTDLWLMAAVAELRDRARRGEKR
jgi:hypothetical protein